MELTEETQIKNDLKEYMHVRFEAIEQRLKRLEEVTGIAENERQRKASEEIRSLAEQTESLCGKLERQGIRLEGDISKALYEMAISLYDNAKRIYKKGP